jgi:hypothetical protein
MPPSGDAQPLRPLVPSNYEGNTVGRKNRHACPHRSCTATKPPVLAASTIRAGRPGTLRRSGRALPGTGVSASGGPDRYEIRVAGILDSRWTAWFDDLQINCQGEETIICGLVADQPALHGLLTKVRDLGLCLISVRRVGDGGARDEHPARHRPPPRALRQDSRPEQDDEQTWGKT